MHSIQSALLYRGGAAVLYGVVAVTGGVVVYMRLVRGWSLGDMLYVTRSGLKKSISQVTEGEGSLRPRAWTKGLWPEALGRGF